MEGNMGYTYRGDLPQTGVRFRTEDAALQELFELAQQKAKKNIFDFGGTKVMIDGSAAKYTPRRMRKSLSAIS